MLKKARFILSKKKVLEQYNRMKDMADTVSYSHKTNIQVSKILEEETDSLFSVHSVESLSQLKYGKRVWFIAQAWSHDELNAIFSRNVTKFIVDNRTDLNVLLDYLKKKNKKVSLLLRMRLKEHTVHTGKYYVYGFYSSQVNPLIRELKRNAHIIMLGIHFHRKTQNVSEWSLLEELQQSIDSDNWKNIDLVNIGGGIPVGYKNYSSSVLPNIFIKINELRAWLNNNKIKMIIEPGRFIAAPAVELEAEIVNIYNNNIVIDCSVYNAAMDTFIANIRLVIKGELDSGTSYTIKGCTPCSMDIFRYKIYLDKPEIGDKITFMNAGAYNFSSDFCNLPKLETIIID